jgi:hypothetical protein
MKNIDIYGGDIEVGQPKKSRTVGEMYAEMKAYREYIYGIQRPRQRIFNGKGKQVGVIALVLAGLLVLVSGMYHNGLI